MVKYPKVNLQPFAEDEQAAILEPHNGTLGLRAKIPSVPRNFATGWPLLAVSLYSPAIGEDKKDMYGCLLGGEECQFLNIPYFSLAFLASNIPGKKQITVGGGAVANRTVTPEQFKPHNAGVMSDVRSGFSVNCLDGALVVSMGIVSHRKQHTVSCGGLDGEVGNNALKSALNEAWLYAMKGRKKTIRDVDVHEGATVYSADQIRQALNSDTACFANGQVYVDLGALLDAHNAPEDLKEFLGAVFKVQDFNNLKEVNPAFKPKALASTASPSSSERDTSSTHASSHGDVPPPEVRSSVSGPGPVSGPVPVPGSDSLSSHLSSTHLLGSSFSASVSSEPIDAELSERLPSFSAPAHKSVHADLLAARQRLDVAIREMREYGVSLQATDMPKSEQVAQLVSSLETMVTGFFDSGLRVNRSNFESFNQNFNTTLHRLDGEMAAHRKKWRPIVANVALAATGVGLIAIGIKYAVTGSAFFMKTHRQKLVAKIDACAHKLEELGNEPGIVPNA